MCLPFLARPACCASLSVSLFPPCVCASTRKLSVEEGEREGGQEREGLGIVNVHRVPPFQPQILDAKIFQGEAKGGEERRSEKEEREEAKEEESNAAKQVSCTRSTMWKSLTEYNAEKLINRKIGSGARQSCGLRTS